MKVLIIRFSSIGDIVLTSPIIRCIHNQLDSEIHFLTKEQFVPLLRHNIYLSSIHTIESTSRKLLRKIGFDIVIDLHKNLRSLIFRTTIGGKVYSFNKSNIKKWLLVNFQKVEIKSTGHIVDRYFEGLSSLKIKNDGKGLDFFLDPEDQDHTYKSLPLHDYYVLVLGANYFTKRIPLTISHKIIKNQPLHCILVGGKDTVDTGQKLNEYLPEKVIDMTGKLTIHESATIIKHAKYVVTGDTGMMHIAAAFKKKIFVLWGNTTKEFGMYPYYGTKTSDRSIHLEVGNLNCRPCSKLGFQKCPKSHFRCMMDQDISVINSG